VKCPRCSSGEQHLRVEHEGREDGRIVWTVYYCRRCAFTWRDTEPGESIDPAQRDAWFQVDPDSPEKYSHNIPPAKPK